MRLILQENFYPSHRNNSFRSKKRMGFKNVKIYTLWRKRKWCTGFWERNNWLMVIRTLKQGKRKNVYRSSKIYKRKP